MSVIPGVFEFQNKSSDQPKETHMLSNLKWDFKSQEEYDAYNETSKSFLIKRRILGLFQNVGLTRFVDFLEKDTVGN